MAKLNPALERVLAPAYLPCAGFQSPCTEMRWIPNSGHVPRGFAGASGNLSSVELVLVFAEPGDPMPGEKHTGIQSAYDYATSAFGTGRTQFHQNVRYILDSCWPAMSFIDQMERVWLTESVLCSAIKETGAVRASTVRECGRRYLNEQLALMPHALVVALGGKAKARLRTAGIREFVEASAVAPPGCNFSGAPESWNGIARALRAKQSSPVDQVLLVSDENSKLDYRPTRNVATGDRMFKTVLGYAIHCQRGECRLCEYRGCECPHHSGGVADVRIVANCLRWDSNGGEWMGSACQEDRHEDCRKKRCGCRCDPCRRRCVS